jgi:hypothetical protein
MTTNNPVAQPDGVVEAPERIWIDLTMLEVANAQGHGDYYIEIDDTVQNMGQYIRAPTPDSIAEKARRVVEMFDEWLVTGFESTLTADKVDALQRIITTEFGTGGEQGENNH